MSTINPDPNPEPGPDPDFDDLVRTRPRPIPWYKRPQFYVPIAVAAIVLLIAIFLGSTLGDDDEDEAHPKAAPSPTAPATTAAPTPTPAADPYAPFQKIERAAILEGDFVKDFRETYPGLAEGRTENQIADTGASACNIVVENGVTPAGVLKRTAVDLQQPGGNVSQETASKVIKLAVKTSCPSHEASRAKLLG